MLTSDDERDLEKLLACWDSFSEIITEKDVRKRTIDSIISNLETVKLRDQIRKISGIFNSISSEARLLILLILYQFNAFHYELEYILGLSQPTISHHVHKLVDAGLIEQSKRDKIVFLSITKLGKIIIENIKSILRETSDVLLL